MDCFSHKDSCRIGLHLEYYISVLKALKASYEFFITWYSFFFFIISPTVELLCVELIDLYTVLLQILMLLWTAYSTWEIQRVVQFLQYRQSYFLTFVGVFFVLFFFPKSISVNPTNCLEVESYCISKALWEMIKPVHFLNRSKPNFIFKNGIFKDRYVYI